MEQQVQIASQHQLSLIPNSHLIFRKSSTGVLWEVWLLKDNVQIGSMTRHPQRGTVGFSSINNVQIGHLCPDCLREIASFADDLQKEEY